MEEKKKQLLRVVVGSQAHGLATSESDFDYRGVFALPTVDFFRLGGTTRTTSWIEGKEDDTSWEISHFLNMAVHCNPTVLETFLAPWTADGWKECAFFKDGTSVGDALRALFPYVWNSKRVKDAFCGYAKNQEKKFLDKKDNRAPKYAAAYLRTLYNAYELLNTGTFTVRIADTEIGETVRRFKNSEYTLGEVMQACADWREKVEDAYEKNPSKESDVSKINDFLIKVRKEFWEW